MNIKSKINETPYDMKSLGKIPAVLFLLLVLAPKLFAEVSVQNFVYAQRDTQMLSMDIYQPTPELEQMPCMVFVFGGGFINGSKSEAGNVAFCSRMAERGYVVVAIDYRLGLKGVKKVGALNVKPLERAIKMAVEDLCSATAYLVQHAAELHIDTAKVIACGSSAGAITVLQADYEMANRTDWVTAVLPDFRFAGIVSFSGAVFSREGKPDYKHPAAPTCFFHGTDDHLVTYKQIRFCNLGFFGSSALVKRFEKFNYPYLIMRYRDMGHEISGTPMTRNLSDIDTFIHEFVFHKRPLKADMLIKDGDLKPFGFGSYKPKDLYGGQE